MTNPTQVSGPGRPMNERRDAAKEQEGLDEVLNGGNEPQQADVAPGQQAVDGGDAGGPAAGGKAG